MQPVPLICRLWRIFASGVTICVIAVGCAYVLAAASAGAGPILVVEGGAQEPTTRLTLGEQIRYGLRWHFLEGGCDSYVVATFTKQDGKEETNLYQRRKAKPRGVGQPGYEVIERPLPGGITAGRWHYKTVIESQCPTRKPPDVLFAEFDIEVTDPNAPVVTVQELMLNTPVVEPGGKIAYRISFTRRTRASGISIATFIADPPSNVPGLADVITIQRPVAYGVPGVYQDVDFVLTAPPELRSGHWRMRLTSLQNLGEGRQQFDPLGELQFEVR